MAGPSALQGVRILHLQPLFGFVNLGSCLVQACLQANAPDCRATWVYEAVVRPTLTTLQTEIQKVPAFERMLNQDEAHSVGQARPSKLVWPTSCAHSVNTCMHCVAYRCHQHPSGCTLTHP